MVQEIRKEVIRTLANWAIKFRMLSVRISSFLISFWIGAGVLGICVVGPVYLVHSFGKEKTSSIHQELLARERIRQAFPRYERPYRIQAAQVNESRSFGNDMRETRNALSEFKSFARAVAVLGRV